MLEFILKFFGWVFVAVPVVAFLSISIWILKGTAGDDPFIMSLIALGFTMFIIGAVLLLLVYLTGLFEPSTTLALLMG